MSDGYKLDRGPFIHDLVYERIREMIVDGRLRPGDRLVESALAKTIKVSRTPVREAIRRLSQERWIEPQEFGGARVRSMSARDLIDAYTTRAVLEGLAARLACENATTDDIARLRALTVEESEALEAGELKLLSKLNSLFHGGVSDLSRNQPLLDALNGLGIHTVYYKRAILEAAEQPDWRAEYKRYVRRRIDDHVQIIDLLEAGDGAQAEDWTRRHVVENADNLVQLLNLDAGGEDLTLSQIQLSRSAASTPMQFAAPPLNLPSQSRKRGHGSND